MKRDSINYTVIGLFVVVAAIALLYVLMRVTGNTGPVDTYRVYYDNVSGAKFGTPVFYEGYRIGQVERIAPQRQGGGIRFELLLSVQQDWRIPEDSVASLSASGLLGTVALEIKAGHSQTSVAVGGTISPDERIDLMANLNATVKEYRGLPDEGIKPLLANVNTQVDSLAAELHRIATVDLRQLIETATERVDSPQIFAQIDSLLVKLNRSAGNIERLVGEQNQARVSGFLDEINLGAKELSGLIRKIETTRGHLDSVIRRVDGVVTDANKLVNNADGLISENRPNLRAAIADMRKTLAVVAQNIDTIAYNLEGSSRNMNEFTRQIRENPGLLLGSSPQRERGK